MISPPPSPTFTHSRSISGKLQIENDNPALSPKRFLAQHNEDHLSSQLELKRRDVQPSRRAPLDPLSASDLENRRSRRSQLTGSASHHSFVTSSSVPDLQVSLPEQPVSFGSCGMQRSGISDALVRSWPPPIPTSGTARSSHSSLAGQQTSQCGPLHSPAEKSSRAAFLESTSRHPPGSFPTESTATMTKPTRTTRWKSDNVLQPIRPRTNPVPSVRRPPGELWRSDSGPTMAQPVDTVDSLIYPTPPGLPPCQPELMPSASHSDVLPYGSVSLSLALGSQPLRAVEQTKAVPPIGAERSRVLPITSLDSHTRSSPATQSHDLSKSPWCSSPFSPRPQAKWKNEVDILKTTSPEKVQAAAGNASMSKEDLERLLRHAVRSKYAAKIVSPLSPLRTATAALYLSTDPAYRMRIPSQSHNPSPQYSKCPQRRARTVCDRCQSFDWDSTCMHCQECKRDTIGKRLLAFRCRQQQTHHVQHNKFQSILSRGANSSVIDEDRMVVANHIREVFAYEMDEEERSLWEEVAAVTGAGHLPFSRVGAPCAAAIHRRAMDDGSDDGSHDDYLEIPDDGLLANEFATLFRDVSVY